jgi:hypothetical protein
VAENSGGVAGTVRLARELLADLTGLEAGTVTSLDHDDGEWRVTVEMLELERVPNTMDVIGCYEVRISDDGELRGYRRLRRYHRSATEEE